MTTYVIVDGQRVAAQVAADYYRLEAEFRRVFGLDLIISSGVRTWQEQYDLWHAFAVAKTTNVRAAHPDDPKAFHVETNPVGPRAIDIRDSGDDAGVTRYGNPRSKWIRDNAHRFNFDPAGYDHYNEPWHLEHTGATTASVPDGAMPVTDAQRFLKSLGLYDGEIDGDPGPKTRGGTKTFQEWVGLVADSIFGPDTSRVARVIIAGEKQVSRSTREIQQYLQGRGLFHNWAADDDWGNQCSCGTYRFQRAEGLTADAKWGPISDGRAFPTVPSTPTAPPATPQLDPAQPWKNRAPDSPLATWVGSPNYGYREPAAVKTHITLHWMDGTLAGTDAHFQNPGTIKDGRGTGTSTQYGIGQTEIHQYVPEAEYAHGDGDAYSNANGISIEHEGGPDRPITDAVYDLSARLVADIAARHQLGELKVGVNVYPHNHWVATECPGTLDLERIVAAANRINGHGERPEPDPVDSEPPAPEPDPTDPDEETSTEPEEETGMPVPDVPVQNSTTVASLLNSILPLAWRRGVYIAYWVVGVILGTFTAVLTATGALAPVWLVGIVGGYGYLGPFIALLATANTPKANQIE